jgi:sugar lactone lactonase YvrE
MRRRLTILIALLAALSLTLPASGGGHSFPEVIPLPDGIAPEGIANGSGTEFFTGSLETGAIYKGDLRTGQGAFINDPSEFATPRAALGMKHDPRSDLLWVSGGPSGQAFVYDSDTGETMAEIQLAATLDTFVNDVVVTRETAYLTDSFQAVIYAVPLDRHGLPDGAAETIPLSGDFVFIPGTFNGNGIDATPSGETLILVGSATGSLYTIDPSTGVATTIDLGGDAVPNGDGILLDGKTLYVVQNFANQIGVVELAPDLSSGVVGGPIISSHFRIPTTVAEFGNSLYVVNARFDVAPGPGVDYEVVQVSKG